MGASGHVSTRVGTGLREERAHGPDKDWESLGLTTTVSVTIPVAQLRWARTSGYNLSRVLRESLKKLEGGDDLAAIEDQLLRAQEQVRILEAAKSQIADRKRLDGEARSLEKKREARLKELARDFWAWRGSARGPGGEFLRDATRDLLLRSANVALAEGWIKKYPELRGMSPQEALDLVLALRPKEAAP